jgi:hypothetical protein
MATLAEIRAQHPEYNDLSDQDLAGALYKKFYSDMPQDQFNQKIGLGAAVPAAPATPQDGNSGIVPQGLSGVNEGIAGTLGFPVDATNGIMRAGAAGLKALGGPDIQLPENAFGGSQTFKDLMGGAITPTTDQGPGQFARRVGQDVGGALVPGLGAAAAADRPLATAAMNLGTSLIGGGGAAAANQIAPNNKYADLAGELIGDVAGGGAAKLGSRLITPFPISADRQAMNAIMAANGVDLTAGQKTGSNTLKYAESELGGGAAQNMTEQQRQQFTSAALARAGISAERATPDVIDKAFTDLGNQFESLSAGNTLIPDRQLGSDLQSAISTYKNTVSHTNQAPIVDNTVNDIIGYARTGQVSGEQYQDLRSRLGRAASQTKDGELKGALMGIQNALDSGMERSIAQNNPQALGDWQQTRSDYKNLLAISNAANGPGEASAMGLITPAKLRQAAVSQNARAYVRGKGDLSDLARAGNATMTPLPQSGTAPRTAVRNLFAGPMAIGGALLGQHAGGDILSGMAGAAAGGALPMVAGKAIMSRPGQAYLANQLLGNRAPIQNGMLGALSAALMQAIR